MKKFIKINLIILVIFYLNANFILFPTNATEDVLENDEVQEIEEDRKV